MSGCGWVTLGFKVVWVSEEVEWVGVGGCVMRWSGWVWVGDSSV